MRVGVPVIQLWDVLLVPLQGEIDDEVAGLLSSSVLERIHLGGIRGLVVDVTGLWLLDSHLCSVISRIAASAHLMGADTVLCGMSPEIAQTLQAMNIQLDGVRTLRTVEHALEHLGVRPEAREDNLEDDGDELELADVE